MLYNIFYLFHSVIIQDKSILLMTYNDNLTINDIKYRESSIPPQFDGVFALEVDKGSYSFDATNFTLRTFDNYKVIPVENTLTNIKLNNGGTTLASYNYTYKKPHKLYIAYQIIIDNCTNQYSFNTPPTMTLFIDKQEYSITHQQNGFSLYKNITLPEGNHYVKIITNSGNNWCSNPSKGNGFESGRYLVSWIVEDEDHPDLYIQSGLYLIMLIIMIKTDKEMDYILYNTKQE